MTKSTPFSQPASDLTRAPGCDLSATATATAVASGSMDLERHFRELQERSLRLARYEAMMQPVSAPSPTHEAGPLTGVPVVVKDNIDVAGLPTTGGTPSLTDNLAERHAPLVERLVHAGAVVVGKNIMHELALGGTSNNPTYGYPKNPWDRNRMCGGSSGGTAAAVALGLAPVGIGTDTGGSVRMPAALCGLYGFRPSPDRYPKGGMLSLTPTRDTAGPVTRTMVDLLLVDSVLAARPLIAGHGAAQDMRIGLSPCHSQDLHPDVAEKHAQERATLIRHGVTFVDVDIDDIIHDAGQIATAILWGEAANSLESYLGSRTDLTLQDLVRKVASPDVRHLLVTGLGSVMPDQYQAALRIRQRLRDELRRRLNELGVQAIMFPTVPVVAPAMDHDKTLELNGKTVPTFSTLIRHSDLGGILGLPGISVPVGTGSRSALPVGMEFSSAPGTDEELLALVATIVPHISEATPPSGLPGLEPFMG
ncbi:amidase family protein [Arthrobacter silvisoli]|uniref:amidase family protein n=1 Tax=Arthrobacter silvisoli TaxID=2291022 RepID=UPI000E20F3CC|nr:amidase family protein [Arthrobacter silvisoli]